MFDSALFSDVKNILKSDLGLELSTSDLRLYSSDEWMLFQKSRGYKDKLGVFKPRSMTAHVLNSSIADIIHEHIGHRVFFEHSKIGLEIRRLESMLFNLENVILSGNKQNTSIRFVYDSSIKNRTIQNKNDAILVRYNNTDSDIKNYSTMTYNLKTLSNNHLDMIESFADWITDFLLRRLKLDKIKMSSNDASLNSNIFDRLLRIESLFGPLSSIYDCGIRQSSDSQVLISLLKEHLKDDYDSIKFIFKYGSDRPFSDRDFLAIVEDKDLNKFNKKLFPDYIDLSFCSENDFIQGLRFNDLHYTIPLHSGKILKGDISEISNYKKIIGKVNPVSDSFKNAFIPSSEELSLFKMYFTDRKKLALKYSYDFFRQSQVSTLDTISKAKCVYNALINLSYAISYNYDALSFRTPSFCKDQKYFDTIVADESSDLSKCRKLVKNMCVQNYIPITQEYIGLFNKTLSENN
ncbi:MAG: hypothetical protein ACP5N1_02085 [Candidatus Woesearchaeota archaeon]